MAQHWTADAARALFHRWSDRKIEKAGGAAADFDAVESWLLSQHPESLDQAERLLALILELEAGRAHPPESILSLSGSVRRLASEGEGVSFDPQATGPVLGRA